MTNGKNRETLWNFTGWKNRKDEGEGVIFCCFFSIMVSLVMDVFIHREPSTSYL